jgi:uncharacterized small protein (DUF1192 family)
VITDDDTPRPRPIRLQKPVLDLLGVEELGEYIGELHAEIARVQAELDGKARHRQAADSFFRKP